MPGCRLVTKTVTLSGNWEQLIEDGVLKCERISFRADADNAGIIGIGDEATAIADGAAGTGGEIIPIPVDTIPAAPIVYESSKMWYQLDNFWVRGTENDILYINMIVTP